jgi:hypothetical protein
MIMDNQFVVAVDTAEDTGEALVWEILDMKPHPSAPTAKADP